MGSSDKYNPSEIEQKWYDFWMENNYFHSEPDDREPYTIVIPPPNVTGVLHMGHMLNNTIQDVLIRRARLKGYNACWVPGTDHASIATEAKVVNKLKSEGINKSDLTRDQFLGHAWEWTHKHGGIILEQLKKLGCSCDWDRTKFTMDTDMNESVIKVFVDLYNKGLVYRGYRMVNWDPEAKTTLSDEEVEYVEKQGKLYHVSYQIEGSDEMFTIATTRPETILGDTAICINPNDERHQNLKGKKAIVPICGRVIPIIEDEYVDIEFGTGCLKVTPAHDENDKVLGEKHNLEVIDIFNEDASLNSYGMHYEGQDRFVVRKQITKELEEKGHIVKIEDYQNRVGISERTKAIIEPRLSDQWFLKMEDLVKPAIKAVLEDDEVKLFPKKFENTYRHWMEGIRDWNISRQLWWGQQIPAYYYGDGKEDFVVAENMEDAVQFAQEKTGNTGLTASDLKQDEDALDTWFSSWLWPMSVFDGIRNPENKEIQYYYPTNDLVTGPDILFFWVARMIIAGYEYKGARPFENVYLTGLVRDKQRRKMSKQLGNSPDALKLIEDYGADGVRVGLLFSAAAGNDLMFDAEQVDEDGKVLNAKAIKDRKEAGKEPIYESKQCHEGRALGTKMFFAHKLIYSWGIVDIDQPEASKIALEWYESKFQEVLIEIEDHYAKYRLSDALMATNKLLRDDFCSWLLEILKPEYQKPIDRKSFETVVRLFEDNLKILHPFMPHLTEGLWQQMAERKVEEALVVSSWPEMTGVINKKLIDKFLFAKEVVSGIRSIKKKVNLPTHQEVACFVVNTEKVSPDMDAVIKKSAVVSEVNYVEEKLEGAMSFRVKSNEYYVPVEIEINVEEEIAKLRKELERHERNLMTSQKKLSNERFVSNAPEQVIAVERKKEADAKAAIETIKESLAALN